MPARSNDFQKLVAHIQRQLAGNGSVTESAMLPDRDGTLREVDVLLEGDLGAHGLRVAVECRDHGRPADVTWIDQLSGKYRDLKVDRVVAVSNSGFTDAALSKAGEVGVVPVTLSEACNAEWAASVRELGSVQLTRTHNEIRSAHVRIIGDVPEHLNETDSSVFTIRDPTGGSGTIPMLAYQEIAKADTKAQIDRFFAQNPFGMMRLDMRLAGWTLVDRNGAAWPLESAEVMVSRRVEEVIVNLTHGSFAGAAVAYGTGSIGGLKLSVVSAATPNSPSPAPLSITTYP